MPRLTDKERKEIVAEYVDCQSYNRVAKNHKISATTVKKWVKQDTESVKKCEQKKEENTQSMLDMIAKTNNKRLSVISKIVDAIDEKVEKIDAFTNVKDLASAYGVLIDKELKFSEMQNLRNSQNKLTISIPAKDIGKAFVDVNRWIDERKYNEYWFEGGRASIKSSFWSEKFMEVLENNPRYCAICIRKVGNTLKDSVYAQILWGIEKLEESFPGIKDRWKGTTSPLQIINKETGQVIYFRGADDPGKIKSIKPPKDKYIALNLRPTSKY